MKEPEIMSIRQLRNVLTPASNGLLFHFGTSFISQVIIKKTRESKDEIVPSHVAIVYNNFIYESTVSREDVGIKTIPAGVKRYLLKDFFKKEKNKDTTYYYAPFNRLFVPIMEEHIFRPYGKDTIVDFLIKSESAGDSNGLICSQYVNMCTDLIPNMKCPTPADMFRAIINIGE